MTVCANCFKPIERFNGYDYALRAATWRHEDSGLVYCQTTIAEPMPQACELCRMYEPNHAPTCLHALVEAVPRSSSQQIPTSGANRHGA